MNNYIGFDGYKLGDIAREHANKILVNAGEKEYPGIVNPCVTGDTVIATVDGPRSFRELADDGLPVQVYSWHPDTKLPVIRWMHYPHCTQRDAELLAITFDSGLIVRCTKNHGFYSFRGNRIEAQNLKPGQSIRAFSASRDSTGHERIHAWDSRRNAAAHQWTHRMVWENAHVTDIPEGCVIAHLNQDGSDNRLENLALMSDIQHRRYDMPMRQARGFNGHCPNHKVVSVEPAGRGDVYNGTVEDSHTYIILDPDPVAGHMSGIVSANCGEIPLAIWGGFCLIGDLIPYHAWLRSNDLGFPELTYRAAMADFELAGEEMARFLIRTNLMQSLYKWEVERTNRIGVGLTGIHEWAWAAYGYTFRDLINGAQNFWDDIAHVSRSTIESADAYSDALGLMYPETVTTIKPSGTVSKLWSLTEGAHLPARPFYLRWVQYREDDPLVKEYQARGYPVRGPLKTYHGTMIVGFPTATELATIMPADKIVTAADATFEEQCQWVSLIERYWLEGNDPAYKNRAGQVSYTLKYDPAKISMDEFGRLMAKWMPKLKAISVMPQEPDGASSYEYLPEEMISKERYDEIVAGIDRAGVHEDVDFAHIDCASGACPIDFDKEELK